MDNIIKFPTLTEKEYANGTKVAREAFTKLKATEENLNWRLNFNDWHDTSLVKVMLRQ